MDDSQTIVFFDGVCNLCNSSVNWLIDHDSKNRLRFAPQQGETFRRAQEAYPDMRKPCDSIILFDHGKVYRHSDAVLHILKRIGGWWSLLYVFILLPPFLRNPLYNIIARNRYRWFGRTEACRIPTPELKEKFLE